MTEIYAERDHLRAVVALWFIAREPIDGANDPRDLVSTDWQGAQFATERLVAGGYLAWADEQQATEHAENGGSYSMVVPTASGIFEAMR